MKRCKAPPTTPDPVPIVHRRSVYRLGQLQAVLGLRPSSLKREIRLGRLIVSKRCGTYFIVGESVLSWLRAGEVHRQRPENHQTKEDEHATTQ